MSMREWRGRLSCVRNILRGRPTGYRLQIETGRLDLRAGTRLHACDMTCLELVMNDVTVSGDGDRRDRPDV